MREHFRVQYFPIQLIFWALVKSTSGSPSFNFHFSRLLSGTLGVQSKAEHSLLLTGTPPLWPCSPTGEPSCFSYLSSHFQRWSRWESGERWVPDRWQVNLRHTVLFVSGLMALGTVLRCGRKLTKLFFSEKINQTIFLFRYLNCCLQLPWKCHLHPFL